MFRTLLRVGALTAGLWLCLGAPRPAGAQTYSIQQLGTAINESSGINAQAMVAGSHDAPDGDYHAFRWNSGVLFDLGTLGGTESEGYAINDRGDVVGIADTPAGDLHATLSLNGAPLLDIDGRPGLYSEARAINNSGTVGGLAQTTPVGSVPTYHAFAWNAGVVKDLGTLGGPNSVVYGINSSGVMVGGAQVPAVIHHAVQWDTSGKITDLGILPGDTWSYAYAINDAGLVAGVGGTIPNSGIFHAVVWSGGVPENLGTLFSPVARNSEALAVNNQGVVVGWSSTDSLDTQTLRHAFIWTAATGMRDLNTLLPPNSGWLLRRATGINDRGQIVGEGQRAGQELLFVLTRRLEVGSGDWVGTLVRQGIRRRAASQLRHRPVRGIAPWVPRCGKL